MKAINSFGLIVFFGEIFLALVLIMAHKKRKNEIPLFLTLSDSIKLLNIS